MATDTELLDWIEYKSDLHKTVDVLYIPGGYEVSIHNSRNGTEAGPYFDRTLRGALRLAMKANP